MRPLKKIQSCSWSRETKNLSLLRLPPTRPKNRTKEDVRERPHDLFYHETTQNHVEKPVCIFISVGGHDILDPAMPV